MIFKTKYLSILLSLGLAACSSGNVEPQGDEADDQEPVLLEFSMSRSPGVNANGQGCDGYKADGEQTAYRVVLINDNAVRSQGTYRYATATETGQRTGLLIPCRVDEDGHYVEDDRESGCYAYNRTYTMVLYSPAVPLYPIVGLSNVWAYILERPGKNPVYSSEAIQVFVDGRGEYRDGTHYETVDMDQYDNNNDPNGDYDPFTLRERRSRLRFEMSTGDELEEAHIKLMQLQRLYQQAYYTPINQTYYIIKEEDLDDEAKKNYDLDKDNNFDCQYDYDVTFYEAQNKGDYYTLTKTHVFMPDETTAEATDTDNAGNELRWINIFSMDYGGKDASYGKNVHDVPRLHIEFDGGADEDGAYVNIDLGFNFQAHYQYTFRVIINSATVHITLYMTPWDDGGTSESTVGTAVRDLGTYQIGWTNVNSGEGVI